MTRDNIIRMAREAGLTEVVRQHDDGTVTLEVPNMPKLERFAARVAAAEREACAQIAEEWFARVVAAAIRARGEKNE